MRSSENIAKIVKNLDLDIDTNPQTDQAVLSELLDAQKKSMKQQPAYTLPNIRRFIMKNPMTKFAVAAVIIIGVLIGVNPFGNSKANVLWADVAEHFESVPFFHLTMYIGQDAVDTKKIEVWKSTDSQVRAHEGNKVFFADFSRDTNKITIFDRSTKELLHSDENTPMFLRLLCNDGRFSLDTLTKSLPPQVKGINPIETIDTAASRETVLFEARHESTPERLKIWALRESKLPIRVLFTDPRKNEYGDFFFDYSEQKDVKFFDPKAFLSQ